MGGVLGGLLITKFKKVKWQLFAGILFQVCFIGAMAAVTEETPAMAIAFVALAAIGVGWCQTAGILLVQVGAADEDIGVATG